MPAVSRWGNSFGPTSKVSVGHWHVRANPPWATSSPQASSRDGPWVVAYGAEGPGAIGQLMKNARRTCVRRLRLFWNIGEKNLQGLLRPDGSRNTATSRSNLWAGGYPGWQPALDGPFRGRSSDPPQVANLHYQ